LRRPPLSGALLRLAERGVARRFAPRPSLWAAEVRSAIAAISAANPRCRRDDELYPNGIFEFNITRLLNYIGAAARLRAELVALRDMPYAATGANLNERTILERANLSRPVILAEIAPGQYNVSAR